MSLGGCVIRPPPGVLHGGAPIDRTWRLNQRRLRFAPARAYMPSMQDRDYWTKALEHAERDLQAASKLTDVNAAAQRLMRAKAGLKALEQASAKRSKRHVTRAGASAGAAS